MSAAPFPTIFDLRNAHRQLLHQQREGAVPDAFAGEVMLFVERARRTGAWLDVEEHRDAAQGLIDYWTTTLYRSAVKVPETDLVDFDPTLAPTLGDELCPYVGLTAFDELTSDRFFGRERMVKIALQRLETERFLSILGPSGSGKSSLLLGGIIPALKAGGVEGSADWHYLPPIVPGSDPVANLAAVFDPAKLADRTTVIVVDQFEELFTLTATDRERNQFASYLLQRLEDAAPRLILLVTMRSDYETHLAKVPRLQELFEKGDLRATPLTAAELREAVEKPAERIGLKFEAGVVDTLVADVLGEPAALPLLQFTLLRLWQERDHNRITLAAYKKIGGSRGALARAADALYGQLLPEDQVIMRKILLRMVRPAAGEETTRRRIRVQELEKIGHAPQNVERVLAKLVEARLVRRSAGETPADDQVEVADEALIRNWPLLVTWLEDLRAQLMRVRRFEALAEEWERFNREYGFLDAKQVEDAEEWMASEEAADIGVTESLAALVAASRTMIEEKRRSERRAKAIVSSIGLILVAIVIYSLLRGNRHLRESVRKSEETARITDEYVKKLEAEQAENRKLLADLSVAVETTKAQEREADKTQTEAYPTTPTAPRMESFAPNAPDIQPPELLATAEELGLRKALVLIPPGASVGSYDGGVNGSLCCLVQDLAGQQYLLSHVFAVGREKTEVIQPAQIDGKGQTIGTVVRVGPKRSGALIRFDPKISFDLTGSKLGPILRAGRRVRVGDEVRMISRGSGLVKGSVILNRGGEFLTNFETRVDTGAPVVNAKNELVGILYFRAGFTSNSVVLPIAPILQELGVTLVEPPPRAQ